MKALQVDIRGELSSLKRGIDFNFGVQENGWENKSKSNKAVKKSVPYRDIVCSTANEQEECTSHS